MSTTSNQKAGPVEHRNKRAGMELTNQRGTRQLLSQPIFETSDKTRRRQFRQRRHLVPGGTGCGIRIRILAEIAKKLI
jgi:hypothetical protein